MKESTVSKGFPYIPILAIIFITLKLAGIGVVATWSWWWVLSPLWIPIVIGLGFLIIFGVLWILGQAFSKR